MCLVDDDCVGINPAPDRIDVSIRRPAIGHDVAPWQNVSLNVLLERGRVAIRNFHKKTFHHDAVFSP